MASLRDQIANFLYNTFPAKEVSVPNYDWCQKTADDLMVVIQANGWADTVGMIGPKVYPPAEAFLDFPEIKSRHEPLPDLEEIFHRHTLESMKKCLDPEREPRVVTVVAYGGSANGLKFELPLGESFYYEQINSCFMRDRYEWRGGKTEDGLFIYDYVETAKRG